MYTKGERVLRIEAMAHNARDLRCRISAQHFPEVASALREMVDRFVEVLRCLDTAFVDRGLLDQLAQPGTLGAVPVGGIDTNRRRMRAVMEAVTALSPNPRGFTTSEHAARVRELLGDPSYSPSKAVYDLRELRSKGLATSRDQPAPEPGQITATDFRYRRVHEERQCLFAHLGIAA